MSLQVNVSLPTVAGPTCSNNEDSTARQRSASPIDYLLPILIIHGAQVTLLGFTISSRTVVPHLAGYFGTMVAMSVITLCLGMYLGHASVWRGIYHGLYLAANIYGIVFVARKFPADSLIWMGSSYLTLAIGLLGAATLLLFVHTLDCIYVKATSAAGDEPGPESIIDFGHVISFFTATCSRQRCSRTQANEPLEAPENHKMTGHQRGNFINWLFQIRQKSPDEEMLLGQLPRDPSQILEKSPEEEDETLLGPDYV